MENLLINLKSATSKLHNYEIISDNQLSDLKNEVQEYLSTGKSIDDLISNFIGRFYDDDDFEVPMDILNMIGYK